MTILSRRGLLVTTMLAALASPAYAQRSALAAALMQFEQAVTREAVSAEWRGIRPGWVQQLSQVAGGGGKSRTLGP